MVNTQVVKQVVGCPWPVSELVPSAFFPEICGLLVCVGHELIMPGWTYFFFKEKEYLMLENIHLKYGIQTNVRRVSERLSL